MSHRRASSSTGSQDKQSGIPFPSLVPLVAAVVLVGSTSVAEAVAHSPAAEGHSSQVVGEQGSSYLIIWCCRPDVGIEMRARGW